MQPLLRPVGVGSVPEEAWVSELARRAMVAEAGRSDPLETGGMLLGYIATEVRPVAAVVELIIGPGPCALHLPTRFAPDSGWQQSQLERAYAARSATTYLGDWHSHPRGLGAPSRRDTKTARRISRSRRARAPHPLMAIMFGSQKDGWNLEVHCLKRRRLHALDVRVFTETRA
jgi:integrative and conjugative element protein (TIGR02256 family)